MPIPTRRLALVALALAVVRLVLPDEVPGGPLLLAAVVLVAAVVDWAAAVPPGEIVVERSVPAVVGLGSEADLRWRVTNRARRRVRAHVADELAPSLRAGRRRFTVDLPSRATATVRTTVRPSRRGRFTPTEVAVRTEGPAGLAARQARRDVPGLVRVYPPFRSREEAELRIEKARILEVGLRSAKGRGSGTEFDQLRDYGPDDDHRRIDWAATARTGRAIVRTYRAERNQVVVLLLDAGRTMAGQVAGVPRLEHAMDAAMCVTAVATRLGDKTGLITFERGIRAVVPPAAGRHQLGRVTEAMYDLEPELVEADVRAAFAATITRFRRRSMIVLLTDLVEQSVGESLLPALPLVARSHLVLVGAVQDPEVLRGAGTTARLRAVGVTVVDATPGKLAPMLTDAYLDAKAVGRL